MGPSQIKRLAPFVLELVGLVPDGLDVVVLDDMAVWLFHQEWYRAREAQFDWTATVWSKHTDKVFVASSELLEARDFARHKGWIDWRLIPVPGNPEPPKLRLTDDGFSQLVDLDLGHPPEEQGEAKLAYDLLMTDRSQFNAELTVMVCRRIIHHHANSARAGG